MGNTPSVSRAVAASKNYFLIERTLAAECDFLPVDTEQVLRVGIVAGNPATPNPYGQQGLRIGNSPIYTLNHFVEHKNGLEYQFEQGVTLNVFKREGAACYRLQTNEFDVTRTIYPALAKNFKTIGMREASVEIDKLETVLR